MASFRVSHRRARPRARQACGSAAKHALKQPHRRLDLRSIIHKVAIRPLRCPATPHVSDRFRVARFEASLRVQPAAAILVNPFHTHSVFSTPPRTADEVPINEYGSNLFR